MKAKYQLARKRRRKSFVSRARARNLCRKKDSCKELRYSLISRLSFSGIKVEKHQRLDSAHSVGRSAPISFVNLCSPFSLSFLPRSPQRVWLTPGYFFTPSFRLRKNISSLLGKGKNNEISISCFLHIRLTYSLHVHGSFLSWLRKIAKGSKFSCVGPKKSIVFLTTLVQLSPPKWVYYVWISKT